MTHHNIIGEGDITEGLISNDFWNVFDCRLLTYVKSPIQLRFLSTRTNLIGCILRHGIVDFLDYLQKNLNDYLSDNIHILGTENRLFYSKTYKNIDDQMEIEVTCLAPTVFHQIRHDLGITSQLFRLSFSPYQLRDFTNPGKSGSLMYKTLDDLFILKTLREYEARYLLQILSGYHLQINQRPTFLNRYIGLYSLRFPTSLSYMEIYIVVMINIFPMTTKINEIFDLKGSTIKRKLRGNISKDQLHKLKDLDFKDLYPRGILLPKTIYDRLHLILSNDAKILKKLQITDFSLILGIRHLDVSVDDLMQRRPTTGIAALFHMSQRLAMIHLENLHLEIKASEDYSLSPVCYFKPMEIIDQNFDRTFFYNQDLVAFNTWPIPGIINGTNQRIYIYLSLIDILQTYDFMKQFEQTLHRIKNPLNHHQYSVVEPDDYEKRFIKFLFGNVFIKSQDDFAWHMKQRSQTTIEKENKTKIQPRRSRSLERQPPTLTVDFRL